MNADRDRALGCTLVTDPRIERRAHPCHKSSKLVRSFGLVAGRYGVSRQAVHSWIGKYKRDGLAGLPDHSHRPHVQPRQIHAGVEALISQLRSAHPRWGPRRLAFERLVNARI